MNNTLLAIITQLVDLLDFLGLKPLYLLIGIVIAGAFLRNG